MLAFLVSIPLLGLLVILQSTIMSRTPLLHGTADLAMLAVIAWALQERVTSAWHWALVGGFLMAYASALPLGVYPFGYLLVTGVAILFRRKVWNFPFLAMLAVVFIATLLMHFLSLLAISLQGTLIPPLQVFNLITIPSLLLNLMIAIPVYAFIKDLASWLYPVQLEV